MAYLERHHPRLRALLIAATHELANELAHTLRPPPEEQLERRLEGRIARLAQVGRPRPLAARPKRNRPR
jgi:hypothetical protein